ncbi:MAG: translation elongation factor Ts [Rubricoccaceae bacterium]|nr:translation elongation factor Ts [Rubricoccaceae bacterium]
MSITAQDVKRLREETGVGMMDCKRALEEANGDFDAAIELLRKKGQKVAAKRADREAKEGVVTVATTEDNSTGVIVEVNSETDFVARNEEFVSFADRLADLALTSKVADRDTFLALDFEGGRTVEQALTDMTGRIGEKIDVRRVATLEAEEGEVVGYIHPGSKLGVLVEMAGEGDLQTTGRDVAMQAAAMNPIAATRDEVPVDVQEKEMEIGREAARNEGKPEHILDKIAEGKLERFFKDNVLIEQPFVKDSSVTVKQMLGEAKADLKRFVRFALGD